MCPSLHATRLSRCLLQRFRCVDHLTVWIARDWCAPGSPSLLGAASAALSLLTLYLNLWIFRLLGSWVVSLEHGSCDTPKAIFRRSVVGDEPKACFVPFIPLQQHV